MTGTVIQLNISHGGVPKLPVPEARITAAGVAGDAWAHPNIHGGPRQALLLIASEVIEGLAARGYPVYPGALGENITMRGVDPRQMRAGQRWRIGPEVVGELTKIRMPCSTIQIYGDDIGRQIYDAEVKAGNTASPIYGHSGWYASVVIPGTVRPGDGLVLIEESA